MYELFISGLAGFTDTFFATGYFFYGAGVAASATITLALGKSVLEVWIVILVGTFSADLANYFVGLKLSGHRIVAPKLEKINEFKPTKKFLHQTNDGVVTKVFKVTLFRFIAVTRPVHCIYLGAINAKAKFSDFVAIMVGNCVWVTCWLLLFDRLMGYF